MDLNKILNKYNYEDKAKQMRIEHIARRCAQQFLAEVRKGAHAYKNGTRTRKSHMRKASFRADFETAFSGSAPTVDDVCQLAKKHDVLLLLRLESEQHVVQIRIDPLRRTARQVSRSVAECCSWMRLDSASETSDGNDREAADDEGDPDDDENPVPGHEEEEEDNDATDGNGWGEDGEGDDGREGGEPDEDDNGGYGDGSSDDDDDGDDDDDDDDDDENEDDENDSADHAWALQRLIESADRANLILSIYPVRRQNELKDSREQVTVTTIHPPRKGSQLSSRFPWWTKSPKPMLRASWQKTTTSITEIHNQEQAPEKNKFNAGNK